MCANFILQVWFYIVEIHARLRRYWKVAFFLVPLPTFTWTLLVRWHSYAIGALTLQRCTHGSGITESDTCICNLIVIRRAHTANNHAKATRSTKTGQRQHFFYTSHSGNNKAKACRCVGAAVGAWRAGDDARQMDRHASGGGLPGGARSEKAVSHGEQARKSKLLFGVWCGVVSVHRI